MPAMRQSAPSSLTFLVVNVLVVALVLRQIGQALNYVIHPVAASE
jgi:hypothetical protein